MRMKSGKAIFFTAALLATGMPSVTAATLQIGEEICAETVKTIDGGTYTGDPRHNIPAAYAEGAGYSLHAENAAFANGKFTAVLGGELSLQWGLINSPVSQINAKGGKISIADTAVRINGVWASDGGTVSVTGGAISSGAQSLISASSGGSISITDSGRVTAGGLHADGKGSIVKISGVKETTVEKILLTDEGRIELSNAETTVTGDVEISSGAVLAVKGGKLSIGGNLLHEGGALDIDETAEVIVRGERISGKEFLVPLTDTVFDRTETVTEKTALTGETITYTPAEK